jgi:hypothetical protein
MQDHFDVAEDVEDLRTHQAMSVRNQANDHDQRQPLPLLLFSISRAHRR